MANFLPQAQKICWFTLNSFLNTFSASTEDAQQQLKKEEVNISPIKHKTPGGKEILNSQSQNQVGQGLVRRRFIWPLSFRSPKSKSESESNNGIQSSRSSIKLMSGAADINDYDCCEINCSEMGVFKTGRNIKGGSRSRLPVSATADQGSQVPRTANNGCDGNEKGESLTPGEYYGFKSVVVNSCENESHTHTQTIMEEYDHYCKRILSFQDAPLYLRFNPHITGGYRGPLTPKDCIKSLFWWTNETLNIWSHLIGWFFFLGLTVYDAMGLLELPKMHSWDRVVFTLLLVCFQACMLLSSLYHIFCCHSEIFYRRWLSADLLGVSLTLLAIYISGIYYAFSCVPFWLNFYLATVGAIFITAMIMQIMPIISKKEMVTEERFHWRLMVFGGWAAYGVVPTCHWAFLHGGMNSEVVALLLPRIFGMYVISGFAFLFYVARIPEKFWPGLVNFIGSSHQIWHVLIFVSLYHWHNTGMIYLKFRATHPCSEEYAALFPNEVQSLQFI